MLAGTMSLQLLGSFRLKVGQHVAHIPLQSQRLLAFLALTDQAVPRQQLAERLWPYAAMSRANANLRTALWRVRREAPELVSSSHQAVGINSEVAVDYWDLVRDPGSVVVVADHRQLIARLKSDLLPGWDEEWLLIERERARQLRMRCLEELSRRYLQESNSVAAIEAAYASIEIEPLRESAHLALIEAHVAEGNLAEAAAQALRLTRLIEEELGIIPSSNFRSRLADLGLEILQAKEPQ